MDGRLAGPPDNFEMEITCTSDLWERATVKGSMNPVDFQGRGQIDLKNFQPHALMGSFFLNAPFNVTDSRSELRVSFETMGPRALRAEVEGTIPLLAFHQDNNNVVIKGAQFNGSLQWEGDRIDVSLLSLNLDYPQLRLSGKFQIDPKTPRFILEIEGREVDVVSTREVALTLLKKLPIMKKIFDIVKGGRAPRIAFRSRGRSMADLDETKNLVVEATLHDGMISVSEDVVARKGADFDLTKVSGDALISRGILEGRNLSARWENVAVREGELRVDLEGQEIPVHLEVVAEADLSSIPPLLSRLIRDETFLEELARIHEIKGRAVAKVVLSESTGSLMVKVDTREINLMARYGRIPHPLEIDRGQVSFAGERIDLKDLSGKVGRSSFSGLTAQLGVGGETHFEIQSGRISIFLGEIYSWLLSYETVRGALKGIPSVEGILNLNQIKLNGLLAKPEDWRFETIGDLRGLEVNVSSIPGPIAISSGKFSTTHEELSLSDFETRLLDASLKISGTLSSYLKGLEKAEMDFRGEVTPKDIEWLLDSLHLERGIHLRSPLRISEGHLSWHKGGDISFKGDMAVKDGPQVSIDILEKKDQLRINKLLIQDEASQAEIGLDLQQRALGISFSGRLSERTLDKIFTGYPFRDGWVEGKIHAQIDRDQPFRSTVQGKIKADDLTLPLQFERPLKLDEISLEALGNSISVTQASFLWGEKRFSFSGDVNFSKEKPLLNIDLSAESLDLEEVEKMTRGKKGAGGFQNRVDLPVEGVIRFKSESLRYKQYTWVPFIADISIGNEGMEVNVKKANLCGMDTPGVVKVSDKNVSLNVEPLFKGQEIESAFRCLLNHQVRVTGKFELSGRILAQGRPEELVKSLEGDIEFHAKDGRIDYLLGLVRILDFLNITEIYRGKLPDLKKEPLPYDRITIRGTLQNGKIIIKEWTIHGPTLEMTSQGEIDIADRKINLTVLVAPLKTIDRVIKVIPLVRDIFAGTLITIPIKVHGDLKDPKVAPLSPSAVESELLAMMKRTLGLPFKLISPFFPSEKKNE
jgi:hypothetical protein